MVFASAVIKRYRGVLGRLAIEIGTYTNAIGDTGGNIVTNLTHVHFLFLQPGGAAVIAASPTVNVDFAKPLDGSAIAVINTADEDGFWLAIGTP